MSTSEELVAYPHRHPGLRARAVAPVGRNARRGLDPCRAALGGVRLLQENEVPIGHQRAGRPPFGAPALALGGEERLGIPGGPPPVARVGAVPAALLTAAALNLNCFVP